MYLIKKIRKFITVLKNVRVEHLLFGWFFSVLGFLVVVAIATNFMTLRIDETAFGNSSLFNFLFFGFFYLGVFLFGLTLLLIFVNVFVKSKLHKTVKLLFLAIIILATGVATFQMGKYKGRVGVKCEFTADQAKRACEIAKRQNDEQLLPACDAGRCPEYQSADVDGDGLSESIVYQPIGMTKGAAWIWIIKDDEVVFRSQGGAQLSYELNKDDTGLTISFVKEFDESGLRPKTWARQKWVYRDGQYVLNSGTDSACLGQINDEEVEKYEGTPEDVNFTTMPQAQTFYTVITKSVASGSNFAGHFTLAHWGCGTSCFGYAVVDTRTGEIIAYSAANENYHLGDYSLDSRIFVMEPVYAGQERRYYKVVEENGKSRLELACTEISTQDMFGKPE